MKKAEFRLSTLIIALFMIFLTFGMFGGAYLHLASPDKYNVTLSETFQSAYTNDTQLYGFVENVSAIAVNMTDSAQEAKQIEDDYSDPSKALISTSKMVWQAFPITSKLIFKTASLLNIPPIVTATVIGLLIVLILFAFIALIFRWRT